MADRGNRQIAYGVANVMFFLYLLLGATMGGNSNPRLLYLALLFPICSSPLLVIRKLNDRYCCYAAFLAMYFISFGALDAQNLLKPPLDQIPGTGMLTTSELLICVGGLAFIVGYLATVGAAWSRGAQPDRLADDWPMSTLMIVGPLVWALGTAATWYWNTRLTVRAGEFNNDTGGLMTTILMLGRYAAPLGIVIIAYTYLRSRSRIWMLVTIAVVVIQALLGFVSNTKEGVLLGGILLIMTYVLVHSKIPKLWVASGALFVALAFPVLQAYRLVVVDEQGLTNAQAVSHIREALKISIANTKAVKNGDVDPDYHTQSFLERTTAKGSVEMIVTRAGKDVEFQYGKTMMPLLFAFIPRLLWPEKGDVQTGELVNQKFEVTGVAVTYISPSHLGDMYWNFGWPGALIGMTLLGALLGWVNRRCDLSAGVSVTKVLILAVSIYELCARMEGSIESEYPVWIRCAVGILIIHSLLARPGVGRGVLGSQLADRAGLAADPAASAVALPASERVAPFPNLMR